MTPPTPEQVAVRVERLRDRVADAGGDPAVVALVAVTKGFGPEVATVAARAGLSDLGENYAQELVAKAPVLAAAGLDVRWHAIGRLQRNKVRALAPLVHLWQSVDRVELGEEIARRAPGSAVLVQVDATGEPQKGGCPPDAVPDLAARLRDLGLDVRGVMAVGRAGDDAATRRAFARARGLADDLDLPVRSMGMSADLELAVAEGSTMIRVGSDLFGPRPPRSQDRPPPAAPPAGTGRPCPEG